MQKRINFPGKMQECVIICTRRIAASFIGGLSRFANQADADYWICAMHSSVHSQTPGKCPICGMDLIPVSAVRSEPKRNADSIKSASASNSRCGRLIYLGQPRQYRVNRVWVPVDYFNGVASAF